MLYHIIKIVMSAAARPREVIELLNMVKMKGIGPNMNSEYPMDTFLILSFLLNLCQKIVQQICCYGSISLFFTF